MPKIMGKYKRLEVFYLSKPVYTADKPSDCHYCYFWTNGRKGCRLGRNNCYYLLYQNPLTFAHAHAIISNIRSEGELFVETTAG